MATHGSYLLKEFSHLKDFTLKEAFNSYNDIVSILSSDHERYLWGFHANKTHDEYEFLNSEEEEITLIRGDAFLILCSSINTGHVVSELIQHVYQFFKNGIDKLNTKIYVAHIISNIPFIKTLISEIFSAFEIIYLDPEKTYKFESVYVARSQWFAYALLPENFVVYEGNVTKLASKYCEFDPESGVDFFLRLITEIYEKYKRQYAFYDNICIVKSNYNDNNTTPHRQLNIDSEKFNFIDDKGYKFLTISSKSDFLELICQVHAAKNIITSYGSVSCTNRFLFNQDARVKVIANRAYADEYQYLWHRRVTATRAARYNIFTDIDEDISIDSLNAIIDY
jgi:hypothetical protein